MLRRTSLCHRASFSPKVIGSACTPCVRPTITVFLCSKARLSMAAARPSSPLMRRSAASIICRARAESTTSLLVSPRWMYQASGPTLSATVVMKAITSCCTVASTSRTRATSKRARARMFAAACFGISPRSASASHTASSTSSQRWNLRSSSQMRAISGRE